MKTLHLSRTDLLLILADLKARREQTLTEIHSLEEYIFARDAKPTKEMVDTHRQLVPENNQRDDIVSRIEIFL